MKIARVNLLSFSPCGHTLEYGRQMAQACADDLELAGFREWNITPHGADPADAVFSGEDIVLVCAPVYGGRIPEPALTRIKQAKAQNAPAIIIASYGNRHYDDALLEFRDFLSAHGFWPVGAAACVAQHTLAPECATGRPTEDDLASARDFAARVGAMLASGAIPENAILEVPGQKPYKEYKPFPLPQSVNENCIMCGQCWQNCPTGAIAEGEPGNIDKAKCIACMSCINICPVGARVPDGQFLATIAEKLAPLCAVKRQNEYFVM